MPSELRHILFRPAEIVSAVGDYQRSLGHAVPWQRVSTCALELCDAGQLRFRVGFDKGGTAGTGQAVFEGDVLVAALIHHCRDQGIPLPAKAEKSLQRYGQQLCLVASIGQKRPEPPGTPRAPPAPRGPGPPA